MNTAPPSISAAKSFDWAALRQRLESGQAVLEPHPRRPAEEARAVLRARREELAQEPPAAQTSEEVLQVVEFGMGGALFGLESVHVQEVTTLKALTPLPHLPACWLGVLGLRGRILGVLDLCQLLALPRKELLPSWRVVVVRANNLELGLLADEVGALKPLSSASLQPAPPTLLGLRIEFLRGVTLEGRLVLDGTRLLSDPRLAVEAGSLAVNPLTTQARQIETTKTPS